MELESELTCPECAHRRREQMPTNSCQFYYECLGCGTLLRPLPGDCCVYCSFGSVPCPPIQQARATGEAATCCGTEQSSVSDGAGSP